MQIEYIAGLFGVALVAGAVDAVAGGGGLLTVPALMLTGLPMPQVLATNKGQSVFGSAAALVGFWRAGKIERPRVLPLFTCGASGALAGVALLGVLPPQWLRPIALALLVAAAVFVAWRPTAVGQPGPRGPQSALKPGLIALTIGAYDGFFGPGTGTFLIVALVMWLGDDLTSASAHAKVVNFASNLATVLWFAHLELVQWQLALPMALGQALGGALGARLAIRNGDKLVQRTLLVVVAALVVKLSVDLMG